MNINFNTEGNCEVMDKDTRINFFIESIDSLRSEINTISNSIHTLLATSSNNLSNGKYPIMIDSDLPILVYDYDISKINNIIDFNMLKSIIEKASVSIIKRDNKKDIEYIMSNCTNGIFDGFSSIFSTEYKYLGSVDPLYIHMNHFYNLFRLNDNSHNRITISSLKDYYKYYKKNLSNITSTITNNSIHEYIDNSIEILNNLSELIKNSKDNINKDIDIMITQLMMFISNAISYAIIILNYAKNSINELVLPFYDTHYDTIKAEDLE